LFNFCNNFVKIWKKAKKWLNNNGIKNFFFFFEPNPPKEMGKNSILFKGEVGFDITMNNLLPYIEEGKDIILDTYGGDLIESLKIYDAVKGLELTPSIGILGTCASAGMQILLSAPPEKRWISPNSRGLIHNPFTCMCGDDEIFNRTAKQLEEEKHNIAQIYADESGQTLDEILALMKKEVMLNSAEMQRMNFANIKKWNNSNVPKQEESLNNDNMTENESKQLNGIENMIKGLIDTIKNRFSSNDPLIHNIVLQDVNGVEIDFGDEIETSEQIAVGSTATVDGSPAEGEYTLNDGTVYVFEGGEITEIKEPEGDESTDNNVEELQEEVNNLTEEKTELQNKLTASETKVKDLEAEAERVKNEFMAELKKVQNEFTEREARS
jgi:ATP-dependent protease ClpP protease subunit